MTKSGVSLLAFVVLIVIAGCSTAEEKDSSARMDTPADSIAVATATTGMPITGLTPFVATLVDCPPDALCAAGDHGFIAEERKPPQIRALREALLWWSESLGRGHRCYVSFVLPTVGKDAFVDVPEDWCEGMR